LNGDERCGAGFHNSRDLKGGRCRPPFPCGHTTRHIRTLLTAAGPRCTVRIYWNAGLPKDMT